ncbi:MAG: transcription elongation factor Spt5 [Candidatus Aenigmatarchaeota archaeon]
MIIAIRTTSGREKAVINSLVSRINSKIMKEVNEGDIIEIVSGQFKNEKGKVNKIDKIKEEAVIELPTQTVSVGLDEIKLYEKVKRPIKSLIQTEDLRGYVFIEGDFEQIQEAIKNIPHIKGIVGRDIKIEEIERFLISEKQVIKIEENDIVEIISGPFKGEKAKVTRIDDIKQEIVVELLEAAIPIPVTISMNAVRIHEKKKNE